MQDSHNILGRNLYRWVQKKAASTETFISVVHSYTKADDKAMALQAARGRTSTVGRDGRAESQRRENGMRPPRLCLWLTSSFECKRSGRRRTTVEEEKRKFR